MSRTNVEEIELNIKQAQEFVDFGVSLERLSSNRDFKKVIKEGYFKDEAIRLVHLKADPSMQTPERQAAVVKSIDAIGALSEYFRTMEYRATQAAKAIEYDLETRNELLGEDD